MPEVDEVEIEEERNEEDRNKMNENRVEFDTFSSATPKTTLTMCVKTCASVKLP